MKTLKRHLAILLILAACSTYMCAQQINVKFVSKSEASRLLSTNDSYTKNWTPFDISVRMGRPEATKKELLQFAGAQALEWNEQDKEKIQRVIKILEEQIAKQQFKISIPQEILLLKTTMKEEGGAAAYTRGNWIVLGADFIDKAAKGESIATLFAHELFHVMTRHDIEFKKKMYSLIGFTVSDKEIKFPKLFQKNRISNPDATQDSYATFTIKGKGQQKCTMCIYSSRDYSTGGLFDYIKIGFIPLDNRLRPLQEKGEVVVYSMEQVTDFKEKTGENTNYNIHPEEILAENFVLALFDVKSIPTPELKEKIQDCLRKN